MYSSFRFGPFILICLVTACGDGPTSSKVPVNAANVRAAPARAPLSDVVMGPLSVIAREVVTGLGDAPTRRGVLQALKASANSGMGIDLTSCNASGVVLDLLVAAERRGAGRASDICESITETRGLVLYMSARDLRRWDGSFIPIVTAISLNPAALPDKWQGYRSPETAIELSSREPAPGPVLLILPVNGHPRLTPGSRGRPQQTTSFGPPPSSKTSTHIRTGGSK